MNTVPAPFETLVVDEGSSLTGPTLELLLQHGITARLVPMDKIGSVPSSSSDLAVVVLVSTDDADLRRSLAQASELRRMGDHLRLVHAIHEDLLPRVHELDSAVCDEFVMLGRTQGIRIARFWHRCGVERVERAWRLLQTETVDGVWMLDVPNDAFTFRRKDTGVGVGSMSADEVWGALLPEDLERVRSALSATIRDGSPMHALEFRMRSPAGEEFVFTATAHALLGPDGGGSVVLGAWVDRTAEHRTRRALLAAEQRFRLLFDAMPDAVSVSDVGSGIVLDVNAAAEVLFQSDRDQLVGRAAPLTSEGGGGAGVWAATVARREGGALPVEVSRVAVELNGQEVWLDVVRDVTHRVAEETLVREREDQLEIASRMAAMGSLAAGIGHEINNPLTTVLANLRVVQEVVAEVGGLDDDLRTAIDDAIEGAERIGVIVRDMRALVKQPAADTTTESDPAEIVRLAVRTATGEARHWARLETHIHPTGMVAVAPARLTQIALNLMTNAVQAFDDRDPRKNRISVTLREQAGRAVLSVVDNGRGVAPELLPRVFEPFFTTRPPGKGVGLGLSVSRHLAIAAGGTLELTSGEGQTIATLSLPTSTPTAGRPSVLVVDDDPTVARALQRLLRHSCDVDLCSDPRVALDRLLAGETWDAIVCDLVMPYLSGRALYEEITRVSPDAGRRFVFLTGGAVAQTDAFASRMLAAGRLMHKPPDRDVLLRAIEAASGV
ncbi:MAG: response regulator [Myxococcales bacterium]|nr:response regulator [Myxococcales bacterium]